MRRLRGVTRIHNCNLVRAIYNNAVTCRGLALNILRHSVAAIAIAASSPALAGEEVLYQNVPEWVVEADIEEAIGNREDLVLYDRQIRLEDGIVSRFTDIAYDIANTQAMQRFGTLQFSWLPDKGDLVIHRLEILRDGDVIDLLGEGVRPEVIRRERQLERRTVNGLLTAVVAVPRLQVGDVLRATSTITLSDQALAPEMQATEGFIAKPGRIGFGRLRVSWPEDAGLSWRTIGQVDEPEIVSKDGYALINFSQPIAELKKMPDDAPGRFTVKPQIQIGTFADWRSVSASMAPHFALDGAIDPQGDLASAVKRIAEATDEPLERTALALQLVQDEISYLMNGLDGGNYLPQPPEETWQLRYGDCKAKSLLLLAVLQELGIAGEVVLVHSNQGDEVAISQPLPAAFDHMIVRVNLDGTDYWLDGTSSGTRIDTMYEVPNYVWALPLVEGGSELVRVEQRWPTAPDRVTRMTYDLSNGVDFPSLYQIEVEARGTLGAQFRPLANETDQRTVLANAMKYIKDHIGGMAYEADYDYDEATGVGTLRAKGMGFDEFSHEHDVSTFEVHGTSTGWSFKTDRARSLWREIPYKLGGPYFGKERTEYLLPEAHAEIELTGNDDLDDYAAGMRFRRSVTLDGTKLILDDSIAYIPTEIPASELPGERAAVARIASRDPVLRIHNAKRLWELSDAEIAKRAQPYIEASEGLVGLSDDPAPIYTLKAGLYDFSRQYEEALAQLDKVIETTATADAYDERASVHHKLGDSAAAQADAQAAYDLEGDTEAAFSLAYYMAKNGNAGDALDLLDSLGLSGDETFDLGIAWSEYAGLAGREDEAWDRLLVMVDERPDLGALHNALCWHAGMWSNNIEEAEPYCQRGVEMSGHSSSTIDSRALVYYRLGRVEDALADLDTALEKSPSQSASLYLRGVIRLEQGDHRGKSDLLHALRISPRIDEQYESYGISAP